MPSEPQQLPTFVRQLAGSALVNLAPDLRLELTLVDELPMLPVGSLDARRLPVPGRAIYLVDGDDCHIFLAGLGLVHADCARGSLSAWLTPAICENPGLLNGLLFSGLAPLLRRRSIFSLHSFAAAWHGRAVLLIGPSGSGKTTSGLALVRAGWRFLANDRPLLRRSDEGIEVWHYPEPINITPYTAQLYPELAHLCLLGNTNKVSFAVEDIYGCAAATGEVQLLLYPHIGAGAGTQAFRLTPEQALTEMLPHGADAWDKPTLAKQFALLSEMARQVAAYRLEVAQDLDRLPALVEKLLDAGKSGTVA